MAIPTLPGYSHLALPFSPCVHLHDHFPACVGIPTLHDHSHLASISHDHFPPHVGILTLRPPCATISHLMWVAILTLCPPCMTISHLMSAFSPHMTIPTSCDHFPLHTLPFCMGKRWRWPLEVTLQKYIRENFWKSSSFVLWTSLR